MKIKDLVYPTLITIIFIFLYFEYESRLSFQHKMQEKLDQRTVVIVNQINQRSYDFQEHIMASCWKGRPSR